MDAKLKMCQYVIFNQPQKFDNADIKYFTELIKITISAVYV